MRLQIIGVLRAGGPEFPELPVFPEVPDVPEVPERPSACSGGKRRDTDLRREAGVFCGPQRRGVRHFVRKCAVAGQINRRRACGFGAKSIYLRAGLLALGIFRRFRIFRSGPDGPFPEASGDSGDSGDSGGSGPSGSFRIFPDLSGPSICTFFSFHPPF